MKNYNNLIHDSNFSWKNLCNDKTKISQETNILIDRSKIARNLILKLDSNNKDNCVKIIGILADDTVEFNSFHSLSKLLRLVSPDKEIRNLWEHIDKLLTSYIEKFNTDIELFNKLSDISHNYLDDFDKLFLNKVMKCFAKYGLTKGTTTNKVKSIQKVHDEINILENIIIKNIHCGQFKTIDLLNLVHTRNKYAKLLKYDNYSSFRSNIDIVNIQKTLKNLISSSHQTCFDELQTICSELKCNKISSADIIQYTSKLNAKYKINTQNAINYIFNIINEIFGLEFTKILISTWNDDVEVYIVKHNNEVYGYIYLDMFARPGKIENVLSIILNEAVVYPHNSAVLKIPVIALICNFNTNITYIDIINIFREMGQIIHILFHRSKYEIVMEPDMKSVLCYLFECIARDLSNIKKLFENNYMNVYAAITTDRAFKLKYKCINTLYDYLLHGSDIELNSKLLTDKYNAIVKSILNKSFDQYNSLQIPTDVIIQLIFNGGILYSDITNSVMAFNLYDILKEKNIFNDFITQVLSESAVPFKIAITTFINSRTNIIDNFDKTKVFVKPTQVNNAKQYEINTYKSQKNNCHHNHSLSDNEFDNDNDSDNDDNNNDSLTDNQRYISDNTNYFTETDVNNNNNKKINKRNH